MNKKAIPLLIAVLLISTQIVSATVNPYIDTQEYPFHSYAVGIASYGVYQKGDKLIPYYITTSSVLGYVSLHQVQANSPFSVQMNVMLIVNDQTFWLQTLL
nr:thermopsin family protease [Sulfuracidifex metallicus]